MRVSQQEMQRRRERLRATCKRARVKLTHQRVQIFEEVARTEEHPDAETLYQRVAKRIPTVSLDTVYRNLWLLVDLGLLTTLGPGRERARFDANTSRHHYYVCTRCGLPRDFNSQDLEALRAPGAAGAFGNVATIHVEVCGLCLRCSQQMTRKQQALPGCTAFSRSE
jgi:Fur family peroxide stress response transcriptional regulator